MNYFSPENTDFTVVQSGLRDASRKYEDRESLWAGIRKQLSQAMQGYTADDGTHVKGHQDHVRDAESAYQKLKRANRAIEGSLSFSGIEKIVNKDAEHRASGNLNAGFINRINPRTPSNQKIAALSSIPLHERISKSADIEKAFEKPSAQLGLTERQQHVAAAALKSYDRHIRSSERGSIDRAKNVLEKPFSRWTKTKAFVTGDRRMLRDIKQIEEALEGVKDRNIAYFKEVKDLRKPLAASIKVEQRDVAATIAKTLKPGIFGGASFKDSLDVLTPEQVASDPALKTLVDIIDASPSASKKDILQTLRDEHPAFSHKDLQKAIKAADKIIKPMMEEAKEAKELAEIRRDMVKKYSKKIATLAERETTVKIDGKSRKISKLLDDLAEHGDESSLTDEATVKLMDKIADLEINGLVNESEAAVIRRGVNIMSNPDFDPDDVPDIKMDAIFKEKTWDHYKRTLRDGALTAGKWTNKNVLNPLKDASEKVTDKLGETYVRASMAFDEAVRKNVTHPVKSAYHGTARIAQASVMASALVIEEALTGSSKDPSSWSRDAVQTHSSLDIGKDGSAALKPEIFEAAAANIDMGEQDSADDRQDATAEADDNIDDRQAFDTLTADSDTANSPDYPV